MGNSEAREIGFLVRAKRYVLFIEGLPSARINDVIVDEDGNRAIVQALADTYLMALALDPVNAKIGTRFSLPTEQHGLAIGEHLFGRVIDALGEPLDGGKRFPKRNVPFELGIDAPGIEKRTQERSQLYTGSTLVDTLLPIAKGQRQLVFGGDHAGKTAFLVDVVRHQQRTGTVCIYGLVGRSLSELERVQRLLLDQKSRGKNIVIAALSDQMPAHIAMAPSVAYLIAEYFQRQGADVLVVLDDLDSHAKYLREIALLEERLPGKESYPGDLFYQQAHLMERSGAFTEAAGGGSITTLPVVAAGVENASAIIPTNLMSCTDGHLLFLPELQGEGIFPAISEERSVTRIGRQVQTLTQKQLSMQVRLLLGRYREQREYAEFSAQLSEDTRAALHVGELLQVALRQSPADTIPFDVQVPLVALALTPFLQTRDTDFFLSHKQRIQRAFEERDDLQDLRAGARSGMPLDAYLSLLGNKQDVLTSVCRA